MKEEIAPKLIRPIGKKTEREKRKAELKQKRINARRRIQRYLSTHPCLDCGESDPCVLQFDHVRGVKKGTILELIVSGASRAIVETEIAKCSVRCGNCHKKRHTEINSTPLSE